MGKIIKQGDVLSFSHGERGDYEHIGLYRANVEFNMDKLINEWANSEVDIKDSFDGFERRYAKYTLKDGGINFLQYLMEQSIVEPLNFTEVGIEAYGDYNVGYSENVYVDGKWSQRVGV